jgi:hypothetical protein
VVLSASRRDVRGDGLEYPFSLDTKRLSRGLIAATATWAVMWALGFVLSVARRCEVGRMYLSRHSNVHTNARRKLG